MEAFQGPRWRESGPIGPPRPSGPIRGGGFDRRSFSSLSRPNRPLHHRNRGRNGVNQTTERVPGEPVWNGDRVGNDFIPNHHPPSVAQPYNGDFQSNRTPPMENVGYCPEEENPPDNQGYAGGPMNYHKKKFSRGRRQGKQLLHNGPILQSPIFPYPNSAGSFDPRHQSPQSSPMAQPRPHPHYNPQHPPQHHHSSPVYSGNSSGGGAKPMDLSNSPLHNSPLSSFASPSSNESSENSSPFPRDPRDPRNRSIHSNSSHHPSQLDNRSSGSNSHPSPSDPPPPPPPPPPPYHCPPVHNDHSYLGYIDTRPAGRGTAGSGGGPLPFTESSNTARIPFGHSRHPPPGALHIERATLGRGETTMPPCYRHTAGKDIPPPSNGLMSAEYVNRVASDFVKRLRIEHSYSQRHEPMPSSSLHETIHHSNHHLNSAHSTLMSCTSVDVPIPTLDRDLYERDQDAQIMVQYSDNDKLVGECPSLKESSTINHQLMDVMSSAGVVQQHCSTINEEVEQISEVCSTSTASNKEKLPLDSPHSGSDDHCFLSISPFSVGSFNIDLDTEIESSVSSTLSTSSSELDENLPLHISLPLSKVSLPTKVLLKPLASGTHQAKESQLPSSKGNSSVGETMRNLSRDKIQTRGALKKQQGDTALQLRNRALPRNPPRNLYLFASRKAPPTRNTRDCSKKYEEETSEDVEEAFVRPSPVDDSENTNLDNSFIIIDETDDSIDMTSMDEVAERSSTQSCNDYQRNISNITESKERNSLSPDMLPLAKVIKTEKLSPSPERINKKKPQKFKDFIPVVYKSRSRAETKTIQRRQRMAIEMQRNESERTRQTSTSEEETVSYRTRRRKHVRENSSPSHDEISSLFSTESVASECSMSSSKTDHQEISLSTKEFPQELINNFKRIMMYNRSKSGSGDTVLHYLCRTGKYDLLCYLLTNEEYNINVQDNAGWTPLHEASAKGHRNIAKCLLECGANPNLQASDGTRPIHDAIECGHFEIVKALIEHGADPTVEYSEKTPHELAILSGYPEIADYLSEVCQRRTVTTLSDQDKSDDVPKNTAATAPTAKSVSMKSVSDDEIHLPMDGYKEPLFGPELDKPVFFVSAIVEMSCEPMLPLYNLKVISGPNPRRHNFHILQDVLEHLKSTKEDLLSKLAEVGIRSYFITIEEFTSQVRSNRLTESTKILHRLQSVDPSSFIELVPLCNRLRELLSIIVENIDD